MNPDTFCTGKRAFSTYKQASEAASKTAHRSSVRCDPYRCTKCGMYHYGQVDSRRTPRAQLTQRRQRKYKTEDEV